VPEATGVDYLGLVCQAHEESTGTGQKIDFSQLQMFAGEEPDKDEEAGR
jgi:hypothetical protein